MGCQEKTGSLERVDRPANMRPYSPEIHPFKWRGFWEFGTGALGDMACHTLNMSYMALDLKFPTSVVAESDKHDGNLLSGIVSHRF